MPDLPRYAELHCLSNFTFLRGASHPEELLAEAQRLGYTALALTDECSLAGVVRANSAAKDRGLKLVIGAETKFLEDRGSSSWRKIERVTAGSPRPEQPTWYGPALPC